MFYMIKIKISFYIKSIKDSKYMFRFLPYTKCVGFVAINVQQMDDTNH
jgi:hypothetical protein